MTAWLRSEDGVKVPIRPRGTLLGRDPSAAVVIDDPEVSRRHALVVDGPRGIRVFALGRQPLQVNGAPCTSTAWLDRGDELRIGGVTLVVETEARPAPSASWVLRVGDRDIGIRPGGFVVGGGDADDLIVPGWPSGAATLHLVEDGVVAQVDAPLDVAGRKVIDELVPMADRDVVAHQGARVRLRRMDGGSASTLGATTTVLPTRVTLSFAHRGGVLRVTLREEHVIFLADRRCDLVAVLLQPPQGKAGDAVTDDDLVPRVWGAAGASRTQVNTLIYRVRKSLTRGGVDGARLIERTSGGGATRFVLAPDAVVEVG